MRAAQLSKQVGERRESQKQTEEKQNKQGFPFCFSGGSRIYPECRVRNLFRIRFNGKAPFLPRRSSAQAQKP